MTYQEDFGSSLPILVFCISISVLLICSSQVQSRINDVLSYIINLYLIWKYPIKSVDGQRDLPTCPYRWPNGQGDTSKFLDGEKNSDAWRFTHGEIYRVWSGMQPEIVITRPEHVQIVFADSDKHIKATNNNSGWLMGELLGKCVGLISQDEWRTLRSITETSFRHKTAEDYIPYIEQKMKTYFDGLNSHGILNRGFLDPVEDLKLLPFWIVSHIIYGELSTEMEDELRRLIPLRESVFRRIIAGGITRFWWSRYLPLMIVNDLRKFKKAWSTFNEHAHQRAIEKNGSAQIIRLYEALDSGTLTRDQMLQTLDEILFANLDVTMGGISWILVFLAANRNSQNDLREEIKKRSPTESDREEWNRYLLSASTLLAASINESSRLRPLAAFSVPQAVPTDRVVGGFFIPAGTNFMVDSYALNNNSSFWGDDSTTFRPTRFFEYDRIKSRYNFWRFGFGPRTCMGKYIADLMIRILVVHVVQKYELGLVPETSAWEKNKETWITHPDTVLKCERL